MDQSNNLNLSAIKQKSQEANAMQSCIRMILCSVLVFEIIISMAGCKIQSGRVTVLPTQTSSATGSPSYITDWKTVLTGATLHLESDGPCIERMAPTDQSATLGKILAWLQKSRPYAGNAPQSTGNLIFNGNIGPAGLNIMTAQKTNIELQPVWYIVSASKMPGYQVRYVPNVLRMVKNGQDTYFTCGPLFDWLKNDQWRTEFKAQ